MDCIKGNAHCFELDIGLNGCPVESCMKTQVCGNKAQVFMCTGPDFVLRHLIVHTNNTGNLK